MSTDDGVNAILKLVNDGSHSEVAGTDRLWRTSESYCDRKVDQYDALPDVMPVVYLRCKPTVQEYLVSYMVTVAVSHWVFRVILFHLREPRTRGPKSSVCLP